MTAILDWIKNIVFFYIIMTAVMYLLPKNNYQKYVRFFGGLLLVVMLLSPLLEFIYHPDYLVDKVSYESFWQKIGEVKLDTEGMEQVQKAAFLQEYEEVIASDITQMVQEEEFIIHEVQVEVGENGMPKQLWMSLSLTEQAEGIYIEKITLADNSLEYPKVWQLKKKIMEFYQLEENQIQITVQEG